jgi:hypothetical protein
MATILGLPFSPLFASPLRGPSGAPGRVLRDTLSLRAPQTGTKIAAPLNGIHDSLTTLI